MKTALVKHIDSKETVTRYLVENESDLKILLASGIIVKGHLIGMRKWLDKGEKLIVNESGGYCNMTGTWEFATEPKKEKMFRITWTIDQLAHNPLEAIRQAILAMPVPQNEDTLATVFEVCEIVNNRLVNPMEIDVLEEGSNPFSEEDRLLNYDAQDDQNENGQDRENYTDEQDRKSYTV